MASKNAYANNELFFDEDPYGRRKYSGYRASDGTLIRTITCTVPEQTFASFTAVWNQTRNTAANAKFIIHDTIRDADRHLTQVIDGRGTETRYKCDSQGREINKREAFGTAIESRTQRRETVPDTFFH
jgi:YD repeat-containing protein